MDGKGHPKTGRFNTLLQILGHDRFSLYGVDVHFALIKNSDIVFAV